MSSDETPTKFEFGEVTDRVAETDQTDMDSTDHAIANQPAASEPTNADERSVTTEPTPNGEDHNSQRVDPPLTTLEQLGAALYYYETTQLSVLLKRIAQDQHPPSYAEAVRPWVTRFVER